MCHTVSSHTNTQVRPSSIYAKHPNWATINLTMKEVSGKKQQQHLELAGIYQAAKRIIASLNEEQIVFLFLDFGGNNTSHH